MTNVRFLIFFFLVPFNLLAQNKALSWKEVVQLVNSQNEDIKIAYETLSSAKHDRDKYASGYLPKLSGLLYSNQSESSQDGPLKSYGAQLTITQNLFSGFSDYYNLEIANANFSVAQSNFNLALQSISNDLLQAYESVIYLQKYKTLTESIVRRRKDNYLNVQLQFQGGRENKGSVLLSESYVEQAKYEDLKIKHELEVATEDLKRMIGVPQDQSVNFYDGSDFHDFLTSMEINQDSIEKVVEHHPDLLKLDATILGSYSSYKQHLSAFFPILDFKGTYGNYDSKFFPEPYQWTLGLTLTIPLYDGGKDYHAVKSEYLKYTTAMSDKINKTKSLRIKTQTIYNDYIESIQKEKVDNGFLKSLEVRAEVARSKYKNGLMSFDNWDVIENDLIQRQKTALNSEKDKIIKLSEWIQVQGRGVVSEKK